MIESCSDCEYFDDNGGDNEGCMCDYQLRGPSGEWVILNDTINPYEEIHSDCPLMKSAELPADFSESGQR